MHMPRAIRIIRSAPPHFVVPMVAQMIKVQTLSRRGDVHGLARSEFLASNQDVHMLAV